MSPASKLQLMGFILVGDIAEKKAFKNALGKENLDDFYNLNQELFNTLKLKNGLPVSNGATFKMYIDEFDVNQELYSILALTN